MQVAEGIYRLELPMPFELRHVNVYLLRDGDDFTLIDTGLRTDESRQALERKLEELKVPLERIRRILITHIHPDHFGLAAELRQRSGAEIVIHRLEVALMEPRYARAEDLVHDVAAWLNKNGVPLREADFLKSASMAAREF
ncbi:MAG TPA: MBL fold metallo-hydrolase, partial [Candidatus Dormibacteraeota bacterium]